LSPWIWGVLGAGYLYGLFGLTMYLRQRQLLYRSDPSDVVPVPIDGRWPQVVATTAADGVACRHLWWPPKDRRGAVIAFFHGNAGHAGHRIDKVAPMVGAGQGVLLVGYRGYGGNPGKPDQSGLIADSAAAATWLEQKVGGRPIVLYGESLGAAVAVQLAVAGHGDAVVIECPFDRLASAAARRYPWFPMRNMLRDPWDSLAVIGRLRQPLLWLHGSDDQVTPLDLGEKLYAAVPGPKQQMVIQGAGHCDFLDRPEVLRRVLGFLAAAPRRLTARTAAQP
jgi:fermentation-respiration switch protein FrsA (DUF1100 family)